MPRVGSEPKTPLLEGTNTAHVSDSEIAVIDDYRNNWKKFTKCNERDIPGAQIIRCKVFKY
jgi:hypothetical protein